MQIKAKILNLLFFQKNAPTMRRDVMVCKCYQSFT